LTKLSTGIYLKSEKKSSFGEKITPPSKVPYSNTNHVAALTEMTKIDPTVTITKCVLLLAVQKYNSADIFNSFLYVFCKQKRGRISNA
jgi:hypothetical protein